MITILQGPKGSGKTELAKLLIQDKPHFTALNTWDIYGADGRLALLDNVEELSENDIERLEKYTGDIIITTLREPPVFNPAKIRVFRLRPVAVRSNW